MQLKAYGVHTVRTPIHAPKANCFVEPLIGFTRRECTDHHLFFSEAHLRRVLEEYRSYYNDYRPHQGTEQKVPGAPTPFSQAGNNSLGSGVKTPFLGGLHHSYHGAG